MSSSRSFSRRTLFSLAAAATAQAAAKKKPPVGLELYSVRDELSKDLFGAVKAVAKIGYAGVEFYSPYFQWTPAYTKDVRKLLDDLGIVCFSTHNSASSFARENLNKAIELNTILGSKLVVMASAGKVDGLDGWKTVADSLANGVEKLKSAGLRAGFHNHRAEFMPLAGTRPMDVLAKNTPKEVCLQLDVGTCIEAGSDPIEWVRQNPGRIVSMHVKDWSPEKDKGYQVLFGEGVAPWKKLLAAAEKTGGLEYYLIEQEGSRFAPLETAEKCLATFRKLRG